MMSADPSKALPPHHQAAMRLARRAGVEALTTVEIILERVPPGWGYVVSAGTDEILAIPSGLPWISEPDWLLRRTLEEGGVTGVRESQLARGRVTGDVWALPEGSVFFENQPVMVIRGKYLDFGAYETLVLGFLCQASGIATKATRLRKLVDDLTLLSFGARRMHPAIAPRSPSGIPLPWNACWRRPRGSNGYPVEESPPGSPPYP